MKNVYKLFVMTLFLAGSALVSNAYAQDAVTPDAAPSGFWSNWSGDVFAGFNKSSGNTDKTAASASANATKKFDHSQFILKGNLFYSESDNSMDGQKWDASARYSVDFGDEDNWFTYTQLAVDHDYFADIDYRVTPSIGLGYHISKTEDWKWDVDGGLGYRITRHRVKTAADDEVLTAMLHTFMKKKMFDKSFLSEDLTVSPGLESGSAVLIHSESAFTTPLRGNLDLEFKYIVDHNTEPGAGTKKTDTQLIGGLKYKF